MRRRRLLIHAAAAAVCCWLAAPASAYIYWDNSTAGTIARANLDGSGVERSFVSGGHGLLGLAVDGRHVFWANSTTGTVGRANLDGTGVDQSFITHAGTPVSVAVDGQHVYWADGASNEIGRANLDGSGAGPRFITGADGVAGLAVDSQHIYWGNAGTGTIGRANLDGSGVDQSFITPGGPVVPNGVAVDGQHIYWTDAGGNAIGRANLDGSGVTVGFIAGAHHPFGVAVDGQHVYWTNYDAGSAGAVGDANLDGSGANQSLVPGLTWPAAIAVDAGGGASSCTSQVQAFASRTSVVSAQTTAGCFTKSGSEYSFAGTVLLDGLRASPGLVGLVIVDASKHTVSFPLGGSIGLDGIPFEVLGPRQVVDLTKPLMFIDPTSTFHGFPFAGSFAAHFNADQTVTLQPNVSLSVLGDKVTAELDLEASNQGGVDFGGFRIHLTDAIVDPRYTSGSICNPKKAQPSGWDCQPDPRLKNGQGHLKQVGNTQVKFGFLPVSNFDLSYDSHGPHGQGEWIGSITFQLGSLFPGAIKTVKVVLLPTVNLNADLVTVPAFKVYSVGASLDNLNIPIPPVDGVFLQHIGFQLGFDPLLIGGSVGVSLGPQQADTPVGIDGGFTYTSGMSGVWDLKVDGNLTAFKELNAASAELELKSLGKGLASTLAFQLGGQYGPFQLSAQLQGGIAFNPFHVQLTGNGNATFAGQGVNVNLVISDRGFGMCGHLDVLFVHTTVGFSHVWGGDWNWFSCDMGSLYTIGGGGGGGAHDAAASATVALPAGLPREEFAASGSAGPPELTLSGPGGVSVPSPAAGELLLRPGIVGYADASSDTTYFIVEHPAPGAWTLATTPGAAPPTTYLRADPLRPLTIRARVSGRRHSRTLSFSFTRQRGESVTFMEDGPETSATIASGITRSGRVTFAPAGGAAGERSIVALISIDGIPRRIVTVARYRAVSSPLAGRPGRPRYSVHAGVLTVTWRAAHPTTGYQLGVGLIGGRQLGLFVAGRVRRVATRLPVGAHVRRVTVTADNLGWYGTPVTATSSH